MLRLFWHLARTFHHLCRAIGRLPRDAAAALQPAEAAGRRLGIALLVALPVAFLAAMVMPNVALVMSPSIDAWAVRQAPGPIANGDLVMFTLLNPIAGPEPVKVTKFVLCLPGDRLTMLETPSRMSPGERDGHYYCNGKLLGASLPYGRGGIKLEHLHWHGIIPPGLAYVGSRHPRGFDSRYLGLVPISRLTRMERLL